MRYYRPRSPFAAPAPGGQLVNFGPDPLPQSLVPEGHWVLAGREELFEVFDLDVAAAAMLPADEPVEQATAGPGEKRRAARARKAAGDPEGE